MFPGQAQLLSVTDYEAGIPHYWTVDLTRSFETTEPFPVRVELDRLR